ncbi:MAG: hypothetical protein ACKOOL_05700 [Novosphingobium sp.]
MSWIGLVGFLFLSASVVYSMRRIAAPRTDWTSKNFIRSVRKAPRLNAVLLAISAAAIGYVFARMVFPELFPSWVDSVETGLGIVVLGLLGAFLLLANRGIRSARKQTLRNETLRPKFEDENIKTTLIDKER